MKPGPQHNTAALPPEERLGAPQRRVLTLPDGVRARKRKPPTHRTVYKQRRRPDGCTTT